MAGRQWLRLLGGINTCEERGWESDYVFGHSSPGELGNSLPTRGPRTSPKARRREGGSDGKEMEGLQSAVDEWTGLRPGRRGQQGGERG